MATRIQLRRGTASAWTSANPVLADGEPALESDTGKQKIGNGVTPWVDLPYASGGGGASFADIVAAKGDLIVGSGGANVSRLPVAASSNQVLLSDSAQTLGVKWGVLPGATSTVAGVVQLAGDLGGTAAAPTVPGLAAKYVKPGTGIPKTDLASAVQTSLTAADNALPAAQKGAANGVATLGADGKVPNAQLPAAAGIFPLGSANNPVKDPAAIRPDLGVGIAVWWDTATEPVNWLDGDYQLEAS